MTDTILFDLDGTLTDPADGITNSVAYALKKNGITPPERKKLLPFIGPPLSESFMKFYGFSEKESLRMVEDYREYYRERGIFENGVYEGIADLLACLRQKGKCIVLATSKPKIFADRILEHYGLISYFDATFGSELDGTRVKKDEVIACALSEMPWIAKETCLMVGDREHDILGAHANGIDSVGVLYGFGDLDELTRAGADYVVPTVQALKNLLLS